MGDFLLLAFIFLAAGVIAVPIASRLGLGSVLGFLIAGIAISPLLIAIDVDVIAIQHFAEFGVVMMLFLVGLELEPRRLWELRTKLLGLGGLQVTLTALAVMGVAMAFQLPWTIALAVGLIFALSSTAIVLQTLNEKRLMQSDGGQGSFSVLLFQDIAVIPMLALMPLLAMPDLMDMGVGEYPAGDAAPGGGDHRGDEHHGDDYHGAGEHGDGEHADGEHVDLNLIAGLPAWLQAIITLGAIGAVWMVGSYLTRPIFRFVAMAGLRELFVATALMMVIGIALLMTFVGLSPALGTFLAGVVLANSEYRHELESDIDPFRGLLLGLFFMTVGASINFALLFETWPIVISLTVGFIVLKGAILLGLAYVFRIRGRDKWLFGLGLAQAGEFGFVLLSFTVQNDVIPESLSQTLLLIVALSMLLTPALFIIYERLVTPRYATSETRESDVEDEGSHVIIAGHGRFGGIINRMLRGSGFSTTVLDYSSEQLDMLRTFGVEVFFGDATRPDLLQAAGIANAKMLVIAIDQKEAATGLVHYVNKHYPDVYIVARARDRQHVYDLYAAGCRDIIRETFDSGVRAGRSALEALGVHPFEAERLSQLFVKSDRDALVTMAAVYDPDVPIHQNEAYIAKAKEVRAQHEAEIRNVGKGFGGRDDRGWSPPTAEDAQVEEEANAASQTKGTDSDA